jgi:hypothetical protein
MPVMAQAINNLAHESKTRPKATRVYLKLMIDGKPSKLFSAVTLAPVNECSDAP